MEETHVQDSNPALTVFAILGFIALLIAGLWSSVQLVKQGSQLFGSSSHRGVSSFMGISNSGVAIKLDSTSVPANKPFTLSWSASKAADSTLTLTYACREGLYMQVDSTDGAYAIPCNAPYSIPSAASSLSLTPISENNDAVDLPLTLAISTTEVGPKDTATITITPNGSQPVVQEPAPVAVTQPVQTPTQAVQESPTAAAPLPVHAVAPAPKKVITTKLVPVKKSDEAGLPDLQVAITKIGVMQRGAFVEKDVFSPSDTIVVKFDVSNTGTKAARGWTFSASLPANPVFTYNSDAQEVLYAGAVAHLTMTFDKASSGTGIVSISADAGNHITEASETNNGASRQIVVQ